jgi:hypothetical protein
MNSCFFMTTTHGDVHGKKCVSKVQIKFTASIDARWSTQIARIIRYVQTPMNSVVVVLPPAMKFYKIVFFFTWYLCKWQDKAAPNGASENKN